MELGLYTFADVGAGIDPARRLRDLIEEIELADQVGFDVFGVGEHHRPDYAVSSPAVALAAAATRTKNVRLTSAVTVLSSDDPVRVFQDFATLDLLSGGGGAEIMAGRGSFIESFPLTRMLPNPDLFVAMYVRRHEYCVHYISVSRICGGVRAMKNITLSADEKLIEAARERARAEHTTLNEQFRRWLADYTRREQQAEVAMAVIRELRGKVRTNGRRFTRDEMNER